MKFVTIFVAALALSGTALAQNNTGHEVRHPAGMKLAQATSALADGEVRRIDKDAQKMTIKHGPIPSLDMPPMTMVYRVKDPAMLDKVKAGDKIRFSADKIGGAYTVTAIEAGK
jgi:Cu(I)/Ag(I) efflux system periplasmic protein CusF